MSKNSAKLMAELQAKKNANADLQRELDIVHAELAKAHAVIVEQKRKLTAHDAVVELEQELHTAKRMAS